MLAEDPLRRQPTRLHMWFNFAQGVATDRAGNVYFSALIPDKTFWTQVCTYTSCVCNSIYSNGESNSVTNDPFHIDRDYVPTSFDHTLAFTTSYGY
jgi:hypothetical protein